jgi:hypothetical protein
MKLVDDFGSAIERAIARSRGERSRYKGPCCLVWVDTGENKGGEASETLVAVSDRTLYSAAASGAASSLVSAVFGKTVITS